MPGPLTRRHLFLLPAAAWAQATFTTGVRVVNLYVTVRGRDGKLVSGLTRDDFALADDNTGVPIEYFAEQADTPLTLGLLFDASGSQRGVIDEQVTTSRQFLAELLRNGTDQAFLLSFNRVVDLFQPLTTSRAELESGLGRLQVPRDAAGRLLSRAEGTALLDAIAAGARVLAAEQGRKAIVVLSDGVDTASSAKLDQAVEAALRADALLYPIRFYDREVFAFNVDSPATANLRAGRRVLERLARDTGGALLEITENETLAANFARIGEELRNQYSLGFTPRAGRSGYRKLRVSVRARGVNVQARDGYYWGE
jgi:VWFA-related protein